MMAQIRGDLAALGIKQAVFTSERALVEAGMVTWAGMGWNLERATELAGRIAAIAGSDPVLVGADGLPPFRPG